MADEQEGSAPSGRSRTERPKPVTAKAAPEKPRRKSEPPTVTDDLTGKFLRVGNKLYRTSDDKTPIVRIAGDRLKTSNIDALPDIIRIAKANGWTSITVSGGDKFKKAAYLAAAAQGLAVENYSPSKVVEAEAERLRTRLAEREKRREGPKAGTRTLPTGESLSTFKTLSERFLSQSHAENARDPDLRRAQSLVAQTISIARAKYPDDPVKASKEVEARRQEVAIRIARGDRIAVIQVRNQQAQRVREITQEQVLQRDGRSR
ncbi:DNA primase [Sphingorhabdus pulchriflava]|uniref:DNA primase n=1 Tax=Sphingorhabdus pulchriflava TaxID=2292257 RepID=A0A371BK23_9SPHN|nr:LPD7 domain-containing protein [Sphingorhabdus pulchriflava]RDV07743.1 DNA primase [Sphingorhabdus pulchriflava]